MNTIELVTVLANIALTLSLIVAVIFGLAQVKAANRDRKERLTLETLRNFETHEFAELIHYISMSEFPSTYEEWLVLPVNERVRLIHFAQQMESTGLLLAEHLINIDLIDKTLGSFVVSSWNKYKPVFEDMRKQQPDPFLGEYFQWMAEQIDQRMKDHPRAPFHERNRRAR